jgi:hypothetical protein
VQGYNVQAAVNEQHLVLAAEITVESRDFSHLKPLVDAVLRELAQARVEREAPGRAGRRGLMERAAHGRRHRRALEPGANPT